MVRHHRTALLVALAAALAAAAPASARLEPYPPAHLAMPSTSMALPSTPSSTNLCSEVCSGYATAAPTPGAGASAELGARLPHDPRDHAPMLSARPSATAGGFHWGDAGIGAGGAVALMVLLSGGFVVLTNLRHRGAHSAA